MNGPPHMLPPRRSSGSGLKVAVVVLGVIAVVAIAVASAAVFLVFRERHPNAPEAASSGANETAVVASAPSGLVASSAPPRDLGDAVPGTPSASLRARPSWAEHLDNLSPYAKPVSAYAPEPEDAASLYARATPISDDVRGGLFVCQVRSFGGHDTFAGDDLEARITLGATPEVANDGPDDQNLVFVTIEAATLAKGDKIAFEVYDRDATEIELIARSQFVFEGRGVAQTDAQSTLDCRVLAGPELSRATATRVETASQKGRALIGRKLDGASPRWGWPVSEQTEAERAIAEVASLIGWDNERVQKLVASRDLAIAALVRQRAAIFRALLAGAKDDVTVAGLRARNAHVACAGAACTLSLTLSNTTDANIAIGGFSGAPLYLATPTSGPLDLVPADSGSFGVEVLAAHATRELSLVARGDVSAGAPVIVGVCGQSRCVPLSAN